ncbi:unnamed protein product [Macrosiphum euphorbiae]|uniref:FLYWCH-type domain-containing protein n=1 Tax=Macrosiphum euphorbiae TaxID=13131 RepID=A0AAV0W7Z5_9HEMI|nr:unnamed protein product [Macrosiphum euphorbiae]
MALMYVLSQKGKNLLVHNNFIHRKEKTTNEKIIWKCNEYKKLNCRGRVHTIGESVVKYIDHTHVPDITKIKCKEFVNEVKEIAITSQLTTHAVLGVVTAKTDINIASQLPPINQLKRIVQRTRKQISSAPPNPATLSDLSIPDEYKKSVSGEPFLLYDSFLENVDNKRILLFSTLKNLELLQNSYYWFADGTFSCTPKLFTQLYTIHSIIDKNVIPLVYVLLPDKSEDTYRRMFVALNSIKSNLNPKLFMLEHEKSTHKQCNRRLA